MKIELWYHEKINPQIKDSWEKYFKDVDEVKIINGDICEAKVDAIVSPANSYGFMRGGLDGVLTKRFGYHVSRRIQHLLIEEYGRELLIGEALSVETDDEICPNIICAPTMIVPMDVSKTINVYLSTRAALVEADLNGFESIAISAMGLGVGQVPPEICARQMRKAYDDFLGVWEMPSNLDVAHAEYYKLIVE